MVPARAAAAQRKGREVLHEVLVVMRSRNARAGPGLKRAWVHASGRGGAFRKLVQLLDLMKLGIQGRASHQNTGDLPSWPLLPSAILQEILKLERTPSGITATGQCFDR